MKTMENENVKVIYDLPELVLRSDWFKCEKCGYEERRLVPSYIKVSQTPCPECGGKMIRVD